MPLKKLFGPCVYIIKEGGTDSILYIGMSIKGIGRITDPTHAAIQKSHERRDVIVKVIFVANVEEAVALERTLILEHRPEFNCRVDLRQVGLRRLPEAPGQAK